MKSFYFKQSIIGESEFAPTCLWKAETSGHKLLKEEGLQNRVRKANRLKSYDYSSKNMYFVTFCTTDKKKILSEITSEEDHELPKIVYTELGVLCDKIITKYNSDGIVEIPYYVIMPNHIHMIIDMTKTDSHKHNVSLPNVIKGMKSMAKNKLSNVFYEAHGSDIWQKSYYDRIIRNEEEYYQLCKYIEENPIKWTLDKYYVR